MHEEKKKQALKKLLEAVEKELLHKPNRKTLDHLSLLAGFQDWDSFQNALHGDVSADENYNKKRLNPRLNLFIFLSITRQRRGDASP